MKSYANLTKAFGISNNQAGRIALGLAPLYFVRSGNYDYNGYMYGLGSNGYYWSSTAYGTTVAYRLDFGGSGVYPQNSNDRGNGLSLRCVAR